jgi:hypothetical protein
MLVVSCSMEFTIHVAGKHQGRLKDKEVVGLRRRALH